VLNDHHVLSCLYPSSPFGGAHPRSFPVHHCSCIFLVLCKSLSRPFFFSPIPRSLSSLCLPFRLSWRLILLLFLFLLFFSFSAGGQARSCGFRSRRKRPMVPPTSRLALPTGISPLSRFPARVRRTYQLYHHPSSALFQHLSPKSSPLTLSLTLLSALSNRTSALQHGLLALSDVRLHTHFQPVLHPSVFSATGILFTAWSRWTLSLYQNRIWTASVSFFFFIVSHPSPLGETVSLSSSFHL